jgi:hypothetical protein
MNTISSTKRRVLAGLALAAPAIEYGLIAAGISVQALD